MDKTCLYKDRICDFVGACSDDYKQCEKPKRCCETCGLYNADYSCDRPAGTECGIGLLSWRPAKQPFVVQETLKEGREIVEYIETELAQRMFQIDHDIWDDIKKAILAGKYHTGSSDKNCATCGKTTCPFHTQHKQANNIEDCWQSAAYVTMKQLDGFYETFRDGDIEILQSIAKFEKENKPEDMKIGWSWRHVRVWPATLDRLCRKQLLDIQFKSNSYTGYKLSDKAHLLLTMVKNE